MRRWVAPCLALMLALLWGAPAAHAQMTLCAVQGKGLDPVAFETITVSTVAIGFTAATINTTTAGAAFITVEVQPVRWTLIGTPTSTSGHLIEPPPAGNADSTRGQWFCGRTALLNLRFIRSSGSDSTVRVTYYKVR